MKINLSRTLRQVTSLVVLCALFVLVLGGLGALALSTDAWPIPKTVCFCLTVVAIVYVFTRIWSKVGNIKEIVVDAEYHKLGVLAKLIGGRSLGDFVEDKVLDLLQGVMGEDLAGSTDGQDTKETGPLTLKRMVEDLEKLSRRRVNETHD